jgi:hypothetical protein
MIVRILTEGQYEVDGATLARLHELDNELVAAVQAEDESAFQSSFEQLLGCVRDEGKPVADDSLEGSDLMLPPPDTTFEEARRDFSGEGLIPD